MVSYVNETKTTQKRIEQLDITSLLVCFQRKDLNTTKDNFLICKYHAFEKKMKSIKKKQKHNTMRKKTIPSQGLLFTLGSFKTNAIFSSYKFANVGEIKTKSLKQAKHVLILNCNYYKYTQHILSPRLGKPSQKVVQRTI